MLREELIVVKVKPQGQSCNCLLVLHFSVFSYKVSKFLVIKQYISLLTDDLNI